MFSAKIKLEFEEVRIK